MKKTITQIMKLLIVICVFVISAIPVAALEWEGSSTGGGGKGTAGTVNGYAIHTTNVSNNCIGYRFSLVNKAGDYKVTKVIDVYRDNTYGNYHFSTAYKFSSKQNKKQLINTQNNGFSTSQTTANCYMETDFGFVTALPGPSSMGTWQAENSNLNPILSALGAGSIDDLSNGDKVLVEPIFAVRLEKLYHGLTVTETSLYGKYLLGASSNGGASSVSSTWGFIAKYTNMHFPNALYTEDGQGLWTNASALTAQATFQTLINTGYGVGIAYTETRADPEPTLSADFVEVFSGSLGDRTTCFGITEGSTVSDYVCMSGYPRADDTVWHCMHFRPEDTNYYVKQIVQISGYPTVNRNVYLNSNLAYDCQPTPANIDYGIEYYIIQARVDWLNSDGSVKKYGSVKRFYIPIRPSVLGEGVTAYDVAGNVQADACFGMSYNAVYAGQRIQTQYHFIGNNSWTSHNNLSAIVQHRASPSSSYTSFSESSWSSSNVRLSSSITATGNGSGLFTVPKPGTDAASKSLIALLTSAWSTAPSFTTETQTYTIPIVTPDVALYGIGFADASGIFLDPNTLMAGQTVDVVYSYYNHSDCPVYVEGYTGDGTKLDGFYLVEPDNMIWVYGYTMTVPPTETFTVSGSVYLEGVGYGNTTYESNGNNNTNSITCTVINDFDIMLAQPNAPYRETTEVITSFWIYNYGYGQYLDSTGLEVVFTATDMDGNIVAQDRKPVTVDSQDLSLAYFKWFVPERTDGEIAVSAQLFLNERLVALCDPTICDTIPYLWYLMWEAPYADKMPEIYKGVAPPAAYNGSMAWVETVSNGGEILDIIYGLSVSGEATDVLIPLNCPTAVYENNEWTIKSGYGFEIKFPALVEPESGYMAPSLEQYTNPQYVCAHYPEAFYGDDWDTLLFSDGLWRIPQTTPNGPIHYTPVYYPDGEYVVSIAIEDVWTPAGMIRAVVNTSINIKDNMYDDWYIGRQQ